MNSKKRRRIADFFKQFKNSVPIRPGSTEIQEAQTQNEF